LNFTTKLAYYHTTTLKKVNQKISYNVKELPDHRLA
jgi:hypothetical protein